MAKKRAQQKTHRKNAQKMCDTRKYRHWIAMCQARKIRECWHGRGAPNVLGALKKRAFCFHIIITQLGASCDKTAACF